ncbi:hypothetical protein B0A50_02470 [Salinomyces thailandicus]|uniref:SAP domain-containing protein n=1 Tax=Salinomyces thailandicus TaxID=706561 RepID=A0A4U0U6D4_9PEZI|nr:hypothetical protein B0A50_02470 [Salinomyces thailandica]
MAPKPNPRRQGRGIAAPVPKTKTSKTGYALLKVTELRKRLGTRGLKKAGRKAELIERLQTYDSENNVDAENEAEEPSTKLTTAAPKKPSQGKGTKGVSDRPSFKATAQDKARAKKYSNHLGAILSQLQHQLGGGAAWKRTVFARSYTDLSKALTLLMDIEEAELISGSADEEGGGGSPVLDSWWGDVEREDSGSEEGEGSGGGVDLVYGPHVGQPQGWYNEDTY